MMEKAYSLFLCVLLILVLFLPSTAAGRALLQTAQTEGEGGHHGGNDGSKREVIRSHSNTASSKARVSSPSKPTPVRKSVTGVSSPSGPTPLRKSVTECTQNPQAVCLPSRPKSCDPYSRNCH